MTVAVRCPTHGEYEPDTESLACPSCLIDRAPGDTIELEEAERLIRIDLVVKDERCDPVWEAEQAERARAEWEAAAGARERSRRQERDRLTLGARLDHAVRQLGTISTTPARPLTREAKSATENAESEGGPPKVVTPQIQANLTVIEFHVRAIERKLDEERGLTRPRGDGRLLGEEKDRMVWEEFQGVRADDVAAAAPYLGTSGRTIMRAREREAKRRKLKVRLVDGVVTGKVTDGA